MPAPDPKQVKREAQAGFEQFLSDAYGEVKLDASHSHYSLIRQSFMCGWLQCVVHQCGKAVDELQSHLPEN